MQLNDSLTEEEVSDGFFKKSKITSFTTDYMLRTYTAGCYFLDERYELWTGRGMVVESTTYKETTCLTAHLTLFGAGFFVQPNTIDFQYIMTKADFSDNMTIYTTIIISFIIFLLFLIWAKWQDMKDVQRMASHPFPDNDPADTYIYELIVFTGPKNQASCKSRVQIIINGDNDESDIRTFPRITFHRGAIDSFLLTTPR